MRRASLLALLFCCLAPAAIPPPGWVEAAEFPWASIPTHLRERSLLWLKSTGITHISLAPSGDPAELSALIRTVRSLNLEADLQGPVPASMEALTRPHGGPLTPPLPGPPLRVSALAPDALKRVNTQFLTSSKAVLWTDVFDTLSGSTFRAGAFGMDGTERPAALTLRRSAQLTRYWGHLRVGLRFAPGAQPVTPVPTLSVRQFQTPTGASFVEVENVARTAWHGDLRAAYSAVHRFIALPGVGVPALGSLRFPVNIPLMAGPLCRACSAFATPDHLIYATAELTAMEYENGILAMEYYAPTAGEALLQLSRQPSGPLVAGGKLAPFVWDEATKRLKLTIPAGQAPSRHIRIAIAVEPPDATAFFPGAKVLLIGEENRLTAQYSSEAISQRSRLVPLPGLEISRDPTDPRSPLEALFHLTPASSAIDGDTAELAIEADGIRLSHAQPHLRKPAVLSFSDGVQVRLAPNSSLALYPATIPVSQRAGREITVVIRNNAPEIRTFQLEVTAEGLEFSPKIANVTVGVSASRPVTFRIFGASAKPGLHAGVAHLSGHALATEPVRFLVLPTGAAVGWSAEGFHFLESLRQRASFLPGRWLEFIGKENGRDALPAGGISFAPGSLRTAGDELFIPTQPGKAYRLADLEPLLPKVLPRRPE